MSRAKRREASDGSAVADEHSTVRCGQPIPNLEPIMREDETLMWGHDASCNPAVEMCGFMATVYVDTNAESPEGWSMVGTLAYRTTNGHGSHGELPHPDYELSRDLAPDHVAILPVRAWDDRNGTELHVADSWDEATGWIYATAESVAETLGTTATGDEIRAAMESELSTWVQWAQGDVYGVVVTGPDGEQVDSCWGFYGDECAREEAVRMLGDAVATEREEREKVDRMQRL